MKILIVRHAPAKSSYKWLKKGKKEGKRPLTPKGIQKMEKAALGLSQILGETQLTLLSSPWKRAIQTAKILKKSLGVKRIDYTTSLLPSSEPLELLEYLREFDENKTVMLVGHETHLSEFLTYLTSDSSFAYMYFQKGAVAMVECEGLPDAGCCDLKWLFTRELLEEMVDLKKKKGGK